MSTGWGALAHRAHQYHPFGDVSRTRCDESHSQLIRSVASGLRDTGFHMIVPYFSEEDPLNPIRYIQQTGSADAVIINMIVPNDPRVVFMTEHGMPFATHGRSDMGRNHPYFGAVQAAVENRNGPVQQALDVPHLD